MIPAKKEKRRVVFRCRSCGHEAKVREKEAIGYRMKETVDRKMRVITTSKISEPAKALRRREEKEQEIEEYYEIVLDMMQEEYGEGEE